MQPFLNRIFLLFLIPLIVVAYDESDCTFYRHRKPAERKDFLVCVINFQLPETTQIVQRYRNEEIKGLIIGELDRVNDENLRIFDNFPDVTYYGLLRHGVEGISKESFSQITYLEGFDISNGKLMRIEQDSFQDLNRLIDLDLSKNQLEYIHPTTFSYLTNLEKLSLSDNQLFALEMNTFSSNRKLSMLNLRNNKFSFIYPRVFEGMYGLRELYLAGNQCINNDYKPPRIPTFRLIFSKQCPESNEIVELLNEKRSEFEADYE